MWPFKKKSVIQPPAPCQHKWKDFPWYMEETAKDGRYSYDILQPYVCVKCKERRNKRLEGYNYSQRSRCLEDIAEAKRVYKDYLKPKAIVEDMVKDEQLVDREYLRLMDEFQSPSSPFDNLDLLRGELEKVKASLQERGGDGYAG